jgi:hypothetical protein
MSREDWKKRVFNEKLLYKRRVWLEICFIIEER